MTHTGWNQTKFTVAAFGGAGTIAAALGAGVMNVIGRRTIYFSRREERLRAERVKDALLGYLDARHVLSGIQMAEMAREDAEGRAARALYRLRTKQF